MLSALPPTPSPSAPPPTGLPGRKEIEQLLGAKRHEIEPGAVAQTMRRLIEDDRRLDHRGILHDLASRGRREGLLTSGEVIEITSLGRRLDPEARWIKRLNTH